MKVLVFGGAGFLGSYVVDELIARGHEVTVFDLHSSPYVNGAATMVVGDIMDATAVVSAAGGQDAVYNFAGLADLNDSIDKPVETVTLNVMGNVNVLEACRQAGVKRFYMQARSTSSPKKVLFTGYPKNPPSCSSSNMAHNMTLIIPSSDMARFTGSGATETTGFIASSARR